MRLSKNGSAAFLATALCCASLVAPAQTSDSSASSPKQRIEVAFVLDTTGSMTALIDGAKKKIWSIANTIVDRNPDAEIHFGLVGYRDIGDEYVTKNFPLTTDIQGIYGELLLFKADGGGDTPESVNEALDVAVTKLGWTDGGQNRDKTSRILFLVGDAPPHMDYKQDRKYPIIIKDAVSRGITVNTVQAGDMPSTTKIWKEMARLGGGAYHAIPQDGGRIIIIETPYDGQIQSVQIKLNGTVIPYGSFQRQRKVEEKMAMPEAAAPSVAADMSSYVSKTGKGKASITGEGDLVADIESGKKKVSDIPKDQLPKPLQSMAPADLERHVKKQNAERLRLSAELKGLVLQRDEFIRKQQAEETVSPDKKADSFDRSVSSMLEKQIK
ncbi:MAG: VWA domain-containing protein [Azoarcus sp.]|jgi:hypothetical protein|nr:VWA domain-containing protein [Azoarcus sp.]